VWSIMNQLASKLLVSFIFLVECTARTFPVPLEFPIKAGPPTFPLACEWLQRISLQLNPNATSVRSGQHAVTSAIRSLDDSTLAWLQLNELMEPIIDEYTSALCPFNSSMEPLQWHAWKKAMDAPIAAPHNHKIMVQNEAVRVLDVYAPANSREQFHNHRRFSFFVFYGIDMGMTDYGPDGEVRGDSPDWDGKSKPRLRVIWSNPEWFHAVYNKKSGSNHLAPNCPLENSPEDCDGFLFRIELNLNGSYRYQGDETQP